MNNKFLVKLILCLLFLCFHVSTCAEEVTYKNGKKLAGKIIKEDNEAVWLEVPFLNGKLVRKIVKSEVTVSEANEFQIPNTSETQKLYYENSMNVEIPKEWRFYKNFESSKIYLIDADDNPYGKYRILVTICSYSLPESINLEKFFNLEVLAMEKSRQKIGKKGIAVINGINMQWMKYYIESGPVFRYETLKDNRACVFDIAAGPEGPVSLPDTWDAIVNKIKF